MTAAVYLMVLAGMQVAISLFFGYGTATSDRAVASVLMGLAVMTFGIALLKAISVIPL